VNDVDAEAAAAELGEELAAAREEAQRNFESLQRLQADFKNYKRRIERERAEVSEKAALDIIKTLLPIIDDFERSVANIPEDLAGHQWTEGTVAIERKLKRLLETYDIEPIDPVGEPFDPDKHQGLGIDDSSDMESGLVTTTLQKGYMKDDKILRPALVRVAG
jgi:molecular chaperone GrpE